MLKLPQASDNATVVLLSDTRGASIYCSQGLVLSPGRPAWNEDAFASIPYEAQRLKNGQDDGVASTKAKPAHTEAPSAEAPRARVLPVKEEAPKPEKKETVEEALVTGRVAFEAAHPDPDSCCESMPCLARIHSFELHS